MNPSDEHGRSVRGVAHADALDPRVIEAMVRECRRVGMSDITEANWPEFAARSRVWRRLMGKTELAPEDVQRMVGLTSDAPNEDFDQWAARQAHAAVDLWIEEMRAAPEDED